MTKSETDDASGRPLAARIARTWALPVVMGTLIALAWMKFVTPTDGSSAFAVEPKPSPVEGDRAYKYLTTLCDFGPRIAGSEANTKQRDYVASHFKKAGGAVREQKFTARH